MLVYSLGVLLMLTSMQVSCHSTLTTTFPFQDPTLPWDDRVDDLVSRLSLEEIVGQTLSGYDQPTPAIPRLGIKPYVWITECLRGLRKTNSTAFPQALGLAASFSQDLLYNMSQVIAIEARANWNVNRRQGEYIPWSGLSCFSPVINIMRHPLWGRNQETYGEDPFLSGSLAQSFVYGLQGDHPRYVRANAGCKHFDVHGGPENIPWSRFSFNAMVSTRDWRMTFLPQFKMCVEAGTYNLMCSYNSLNGIPACANKQLLTDIARQEFGFRGYVVSDAGAIANIIKYHKYLNNSVDTATAAIKAGCNLELGSHRSGMLFQNQIQAYKMGKLTLEEIVNNVKPLFYTRMRLGEFDPEYMNPYNQIDKSVIQSEAHRELAVRAATQSFVLLKNDDNLLPLRQKYSKLALVGPYANNTEQLFGDYSPDIVRKYTKTVYQGLSPLSDNLLLGPGCSTPHCNDYDPSDIAHTVNGADLVIVCLGTGQDIEMEGNDRSSLDLPGSQLQLLKDAVSHANGAPVILLLFNAGPLDVTWAKQSSSVSAILECFFPAQSTGEALLRTLTAADVSSVPAARLPATWPASLDQVPPITNYTMKGRTYRYYNGVPLYPFGYGLSYTSFTYSQLHVITPVVTVGGNAQLTVCVKNTGKYDADEVVQVYMSWTNSSVPGIPKLQLAAFKREFIKAGETRQLSFTILSHQLAVWVNDEQGRGYLSGDMMVYAGGQQPNQHTRVTSNVLTSRFTVTQ